MRAQIALLATLAVVVVLALGAAPYPDESRTALPKHADRGTPSLQGIVTFARQNAGTSDDLGRNLFGYVEQQKVVPPVVVVQAVQPVAVPPAQPVVETKPEPKLDYGLLGTFGPSADPIAVFKRDGELVNARAGDALGDFRVEHVEFEAVNVRAGGANTAQTIPNQR